MHDQKWEYKISIIGLGNCLMGDDGLGIHLIRELNKKKIPEKVSLIEAGISPLNYLEEISYSKKIIAVDAIKGGERAGSIYQLELSDLRNSIETSAHGFSLFDVIKLAQSLTGLPLKTVIYGVEPEKIGPGTTLSRPVRDSLIKLIKLIGSSKIPLD
ncbi:MAG TPA: hydrogenase maturation protease [Halanaerobiales bacterium]|nr:hydrogenase maturation protease [Halanaerobiales bacterium]